MIYENGVLSKILTEEGYITLSGAIPAYHYFLQDHQGNNRVVADQSGTVEEVNHYYPFGGLFGEGVALVDQPYKYNGKEQDDTGKVEFSTVEEFLNSKYVVIEEEGDEDKDAGYRYTEGYVLPTSSEQDDKIQQGTKDTMDKGYDLDNNNCADAVRNGLGRAGIKLNKLEKSSPEIPYLKKKVTISVSTPNHIFNQVKKVPNGRYIKIQ